jgi:hypothetical protein
MHYNKKIPLGQEKIQLIIKSFEDGEFEYSEDFREHPTVTHNGRGAAIWNNIYTQIVKNFSIQGFKTGKIARGPWELIYIFDENTKYLYTFMREKNFSNIHKGNMIDKLYHYSNILGRLNGKLLGIYEPQYQQLSFVDVIEIDGDTDSKLESLLRQMISPIKDEIEMYAIVLVDCKRGMVKNIECVIPVPYTNPMYCENWSEYINAEYITEDYKVEETLPDGDIVIPYDSNSDINLTIRDDKVEEKEVK